jgi:hypothetical protein
MRHGNFSGASPSTAIRCDVIVSSYPFLVCLFVYIFFMALLATVAAVCVRSTSGTLPDQYPSRSSAHTVSQRTPLGMSSSSNSSQGKAAKRRAQSKLQLSEHGPKKPVKRVKTVKVWGGSRSPCTPENPSNTAQSADSEGQGAWPDAEMQTSTMLRMHSRDMELVGLAVGQPQGPGISRAANHHCVSEPAEGEVSATVHPSPPVLMVTNTQLCTSEHHPSPPVLMVTNTQLCTSEHHPSPPVLMVTNTQLCTSEHHPTTAAAAAAIAAAAALQHKNLVATHSVFLSTTSGPGSGSSTAPRLQVVQECLPSGTLQDVIEAGLLSRPALASPFLPCLRVLQQVAEGVSFAHSAGLSLGELSTQNILFSV